MSAHPASTALVERHGRVESAVHEASPLLRNAREIHRARRGDPILFHDKPFLPALYAELPRQERADVRKSGQTGLTELLIQLMLYEAGWEGRICAYVLPTDKKVGQMVADRIDRLLEEVPAYRRLLPYGQSDRRLPDIGNLSRKKLGPGTLLFFGAETRNNWTEWSGDTLIIDEYDDCAEENVALGLDRIKVAHREGRSRMIQVSNPTAGPGRGIDRLWAAGSRGSWFQRCTRCGHRQCIDWFTHIVERDDAGRWVPRDHARAGEDGHLLGDLRPVCVRCRQPFERVAEGGLWVHERSPTQHRFTVTMGEPDCLPTGPRHQPYRDLYARWIAAQDNDALIASFYIMALGKPRQPEGGAMSAETLQKAATGPAIDATGATTPGKMVIMASDVGTVFHVTIAEVIPDLDLPDGGKRRKLWVGTARSWADLEAIRRRFHPGLVVVDNGPETTAGRDWCAAAEEASQDEAAKGEGPVCYAFRCAFHGGARAAGSDLALKLDVGARLVTVDRTQAMDRAWYDLRDGLCVLPSDVLAVPSFSSQMCAPIRQVNESSGQAFWTKGNDHYRLADTYERVALSLAGIMGCDKVPTRKQ